MPQFTYFSIGGQDEKWKYSGILEISNQIFILNTGVGCNITNKYGIQKVIPDLSYLKMNIEKIKAIFIGTPRQLNIGSLPYFLDFLPSIPIYTSNVGREIVLSFLSEFSKTHNKTYTPNIIIANPVNEITVGVIKAFAVKAPACIPNSYTWLFKLSDDETIIFADEFVISSENLPCCENQLHFLGVKAKNKTSLLIIGTQSVGEVTNFAYTQAQNFGFLKKCCASTKNRFIVSCFEDDWYTLLNLSKIAKIYRMCFYITCPKLASVFNAYLKMLKKEEYTLSGNLMDTDNMLVAITGDQDTLYERMTEILKDQSEFKFKTNDLFVSATIPYPEKEVEELNVLNEVSKKDIIIVKKPKSIISYQAGNEDIKLLVNSVSPFNIVPINCYYSDYIAFVKCIKNTVNPDRVRFLELGQSLTIDNKDVGLGMIPISEQYVNEDGVLEINRTIVMERQLITENGIILTSVLYNPAKHSVSVISLKFLGVFAEDFDKQKDAEALIHKNLTNDLSKALALNPTFDTKTLKHVVKKIIYQGIEHFTRKKPVVLPVITNLTHSV